MEKIFGIAMCIIFSLPIIVTLLFWKKSRRDKKQDIQ